MYPTGGGMVALGLCLIYAYPHFTSRYVDGFKSIGVIFTLVGVGLLALSLIPAYLQSRRDAALRNTALMREQQRYRDADRY